VGRANIRVFLSATSRWLEYLEIRLARAATEWEAIRDRSDFFVWMDFFRAAEDVSYIHQQHRPIGDPS